MSFSLLLSQLSYPGDEGKAKHKYIIMQRLTAGSPNSGLRILTSSCTLPSSCVHLLRFVNSLPFPQDVWQPGEHLPDADGAHEHEDAAQGRADRALAPREEAGRAHHALPRDPAQGRRGPPRRAAPVRPR
jgi:hypothetical protein